MGRTIKVLDVRLDSYGSFLGMEKGCIVHRDKHGNKEKHPLFENEIGEVILKSGNCVSTGVLSAFGFWGIDVVVTTRAGRPIAMLKNLEDDSHVKSIVFTPNPNPNSFLRFLSYSYSSILSLYPRMCVYHTRNDWQPASIDQDELGFYKKIDAIEYTEKGKNLFPDE